MVNINELKAYMARKGCNQKDIAQILGITPRTLSMRMKKKKFGSDEIEKLINFLDISNPVDIFFAK